MKRRGLSIRYKILLLLTVVPLVTLSAYLLLAIRTFETDKIAYVTESGLSVANAISGQATTEISGLLEAAKPAIQEFLLEKSFGKVSNAVLEADGKLQWIAVFQRKGNDFQRVGLSEKLRGAGERDILSFGNLVPVLLEASQRNRLVRVPFKDDRVLIIEKVIQQQTSEEHLFLTMGRLSDLANSFRTSSGEVFLVNDQNFILFGPNGTEGTYLTTRIPIDLVSEAKSRVAGGKEIQGSDGKVLLGSFSKVNFGDLTVISLVEREAALKAVETLIRQSIVFFVLLLSASTIVSLIASGTLTSSLTDLFGATKKVSEGDFDINVQVRSNDEIGSLADSFNAMAGEVSRLLGETAEKARMEGELKTAQTVQETLFPPSQANLGGFCVAGYYEPASECGGDWWHYSQVDDKIFMWIGDATGHGAPAALITSAAKSAATIIERLNVDPAHAMELLNRAIFDVSKGRIMMTFFIACFDMATQELTYANASHEGPYLIKPTEQPLKKKDLIPLNEVNNPRLGQQRETPYAQTKIRLEPGDRILFYTDGIPDIEDPEKNVWGEREFVKAIISTNRDYPPVSMSVEMLVEQFSSFRKGAPLKDDITFFMAHYTGEAV